MLSFEERTPNRDLINLIMLQFQDGNYQHQLAFSLLNSYMFNNISVTKLFFKARGKNITILQDPESAFLWEGLKSLTIDFYKMMPGDGVLYLPDSLEYLEIIPGIVNHNRKFKIIGGANLIILINRSITVLDLDFTLMPKLKQLHLENYTFWDDIDQGNFRALNLIDLDLSAHQRSNNNDDHFLPDLAHMHNLQVLRVDNRTITENDLFNLRNVKILYANGSKILTSLGFCKELQELHANILNVYANDMGVVDKNLMGLKLKKLYLANNKNVFDLSSSNDTLEELDISATGGMDDNTIKNLSKIKILNISGTTLIRDISPLADTLRELNASNCLLRVPPEGIKFALRKLILYNNHLIDNLNFLSRNTLEELDISGESIINQKDLENARTLLTKLKILHISGNYKIFDLNFIPSLKILDIYVSNINPEGIKDLQLDILYAKKKKHLMFSSHGNVVNIIDPYL